MKKPRAISHSASFALAICYVLFIALLVFLYSIVVRACTLLSGPPGFRGPTL